jgi:drug/metabolite transporter (DMT)-like permease
MTSKDLMLCSAFAVALPVGQLMFKWAALYDAGRSGSPLLRVATNWPLVGAFGWYGVTALLWFYILTRLPLSLAYPFSILGSGLVPVFAWLILKEPLGWRFAGGYALMLGGLWLMLARR